MQSSSRPQGNPQLAMLASLLAILALLTLISMRERRQKERVLPMKSSGQQPEPMKATLRPASSAPPQQAISHFSMQGKKNILLSVAATLLALIVIVAIVVAATLLPGLHVKTSEAKLPATLASTNQAKTARTTLEKGIVFPRWSPAGYGPTDKTWQDSLGVIKAQTSAQWIEIPVLFSQSDGHATVVGHSQSTVGIDAFSAGVRAAHAHGLRVFFVPLMSVQQPGGWSGSIDLAGDQQQQAWFDSYWNALRPYVEVAANNNVEQMAIATELQRLQQSVPAPKWNQLIGRIRTIFKNTLTYDMNWSSLSQLPPDWLKNPELAMIGVSSYIPLTDVAQHIDPQNMPALWQSKVKARLDTLSTQIGKTVLISEIGYRNTSDALYHTWEAHSNAEIDSQEQAGAFEAALASTFADTHIGGIFFWGWDDVDQFTIKNRPAAQVLLKWYSQAQARRRSQESPYVRS